jgi:hypothetical protein
VVSGKVLFDTPSYKANFTPGVPEPKVFTTSFPLTVDKALAAVSTSSTGGEMPKEEWEQFEKAFRDLAEKKASLDGGFGACLAAKPNPSVSDSDDISSTYRVQAEL